MHLSKYVRLRVVAAYAGLSLVVACLYLVPPAAHASEVANPNGVEFFESHIRPLFVEHCQKCHGEQEQWANFRLDSRESILAGGDSGPAVVAGRPDDSELFNRIASTDDDVRMPPSDEGPPLSAKQIAAVRHWIEIGAPWPETTRAGEEAREREQHDHWAFQPIQRVEPPVIDPPAPVRNPINQFVIAKLHAAGLEISPATDRRSLVRRATYDLHGLPPTIEEVTAFVNDTSSDAYEKLIERLLASPRYGEHWARHWLDVARYSDTKGYVYDREERFFVHSSHYRDWVIRALNEDLPYDRFLLLQLAADLVAPDDSSSLAAMGYLTLGRRFLGLPPDIIDDRIDVVCRGLLGLTVGCARCHDHKYDPIPTADYYSLYGVFQNCFERQVSIPRQSGADAPTEEFEKGLRERQQKLEEMTVKARDEANARIRTRLKDYLLAQRELDKYPELAFNQIVPKEDLIPGIVRRWESLLAIAANNADPVFAAWTAFNRLSDDEFSSRAAEVTRQLLAEGTKINPRVADAFQQPPGSIAEVAERYAGLIAAVDKLWKAECEAAQQENRPPPQALSRDADEQLRQAFYGPGSLCVIPDEPFVSTEWYWDFDTGESLAKLQAEIDKWLLQSPTAIPHAVALVDRPNAVDAQLFRRGNPANKGEVVPRQFLHVIAGAQRQPFTSGSGRLELAQAIVDPTNPLTARVWANRVWLHHFGAGLVTTPSDFGLRSRPPSHPELLDWLASELIGRGWSTKALHRLIMLSSTYQQQSQGLPDDVARTAAEELDPENRLLWRMNPQRLSFEQYRDSLLAHSGKMDLTMGGKGVDLLSARRSIYVSIDRQYLPTIFSVFDFANPDLHSPSRLESTIPQQALFALNHPFVAECAKGFISKLQADTSVGPGDYVKRIFQLLLLRDPSPDELEEAEQFLSNAQVDLATFNVSARGKAWTYGFGEVDELSGRMKNFQPLPHRADSAWQGGQEWPDPMLGWVQLTAQGGHAGDDRQHAAVRRWTAPISGTVSIVSALIHPVAEGDGVRAWIVSSRHGVLQSAAAHNERKQLDVNDVNVEVGDTIDFVVERAEELKSDQFTWIPVITQKVSGSPPTSAGNEIWHAENDFAAQEMVPLAPLEQLAQLLLISNEYMFVD